MTNYLLITDQVCLLLVFLVGLPHGAIDGPLISNIVKSKISTSYWLSSYLLIAVIFYFLWSNFPTFCLSFFLVISVIHFGLGDIRNSPNFKKIAENKIISSVIFIAHGCIIPIVIPILHQEQTSSFFNLLGVEDVFFLYTLIRFLFVFWLFSFCIYLLYSIKNRELLPGMIELILLVIIIYFTTPLFSFTLYFCMIHTPRHIRDIYNNFQNKNVYKEVMIKALPFVIITWTLLGALFLYSTRVLNLTYDESLLQTVFISLASLTIPHMIFIDGFFERHTN